MVAGLISHSIYLSDKILSKIVFILKVYLSDNNIPLLFLLRQRMHQTDQNAAMVLSTSSIGWMGR